MSHIDRAIRRFLLPLNGVTASVNDGVYTKLRAVLRGKPVWGLGRRVCGSRLEDKGELDWHNDYSDAPIEMDTRAEGVDGGEAVHAGRPRPHLVQRRGGCSIGVHPIPSQSFQSLLTKRTREEECVQGEGGPREGAEVAEVPAPLCPA